jgi:hypothetical protein
MTRLGRPQVYGYPWQPPASPPPAAGLTLEPEEVRVTGPRHADSEEAEFLTISTPGGLTN